MCTHSEGRPSCQVNFTSPNRTDVTVSSKRRHLFPHPIALFSSFPLLRRVSLSFNFPFFSQILSLSLFPPFNLNNQVKFIPLSLFPLSLTDTTCTYAAKAGAAQLFGAAVVIFVNKVNFLSLSYALSHLHSLSSCSSSTLPLTDTDFDPGL